MLISKYFKYICIQENNYLRYKYALEKISPLIFIFKIMIR